MSGVRCDAARERSAAIDQPVLARDAAVTRPAATAMVLTCCALVLLPTLTYRMGVDQGVFAYMGAELLKGRWPYVGTWESDFPGLMFLQAAQMWVLGKSIVMFRLFDLAVQLGNAYLIYRITARVADRRGAYVAAITYALIYQGYGPWNTAQREGFGVAFLLGGFWLFLTAARRPPVVTALGIGLGFGVAFLFKPTLIFVATLYAPLLPQLRRRSLPLVALAGLACAAPLVSVAALYWLQGEWRAFYEACFAYQAVYTERLAGAGALWTRWFAKVGHLGGTAMALSLGYIPFLFWGPARRARCMLYLGYLGSVYSVLVQGTFAGYHYLPGLGIGAVLIGSAFSLVSGRLWGERRVHIGRLSAPASLLVAHLLVLAALPVYVRADPWQRLLSGRFLGPPWPNEFRNATVFDFTESWDLAEYLRGRTRPEERIQVWGYEPLVYFLAERTAASRFQATHPLVMRVPGEALSPMQQRWRVEFLQDMAEQHPRYVVVVRDDNWWWAPDEQTSEQLLDDFPGWKRFIDEQYVLDHTIGRFLIYTLVSQRKVAR